MCKRVLLTGAIGSTIATFRGERYSAVSFDSRCELSLDYEDKLHTNLLSFANSDKPGVTVNIGGGGNIQAVEFTDSVPDGALIIEYEEPVQQAAQQDAA